MITAEEVEEFWEEIQMSTTFFDWSSIKLTSKYPLPVFVTHKLRANRNHKSTWLKPIHQSNIRTMVRTSRSVVRLLRWVIQSSKQEMKASTANHYPTMKYQLVTIPVQTIIFSLMSFKIIKPLPTTSELVSACPCLPVVNFGHKPKSRCQLPCCWTRTANSPRKRGFKCQRELCQSTGG